MEVVQHLVLMFNTMKDCNQVPKKFNEGKVTLIHKKGPAEILSNYRPLTVNSAMYGIYSRILNDRLKKVTEAHDLLGEVQAGFRKDRNAGDNLFVLSTILAKAKEKGQLVHKAFVDITKAYDTVSRDLLWTKMENLGFGKVFINCLKALYTDDYIKASVNGRNTRNIYLSRGVAKGVHSPLCCSPCIYRTWVMNFVRQGRVLMSVMQIFVLFSLQMISFSCLQQQVG